LKNKHHIENNNALIDFAEEDGEQGEEDKDAIFFISNEVQFLNQKMTRFGFKINITVQIHKMNFLAWSV
jgi:hypothetical protein